MITELLSPAGSYESFEAAIGAGADAVYVGGPAFGARAYAQNFSQEELIAAIETAHIHNRKLYLTVNTLLKNRELEGQLFEYLAPYYEAGLDAVIVQDLGVFSFIREVFPDLPVDGGAGSVNDAADVPIPGLLLSAENGAAAADGHFHHTPVVLFHREGHKCVGILPEVTIQLGDLLLGILFYGVVEGYLLAGKCELHKIAPFLLPLFG